MTLPKEVDVHYYGQVLSSGWKCEVKTEETEKVASLALYLLGRLALNQLSFKTLTFRIRLLNELRNPSRKCHRPCLTEWLKKRSSIFVACNPKQEILKEKWWAGSLYSFPGQEVQSLNRRTSLGIAHHEKNQIEGMRILFQFVDQGSRAFTLEQKCLLQRTLYVHGALIEKRKAVGFWQVLADWSQDNQERIAILHELNFLFCNLYSSHHPPSSTVAEKSFAEEAKSFNAYLRKRVLRSLASNFRLVFSERVLRWLDGKMVGSHDTLLDFTYFGTFDIKRDDYLSQRSNPFTLQTFQLFRHFAKHCRSQTLRKKLFDLIFFRSDSDSPYKDLLKQAKAAPLDKVPPVLLVLPDLPLIEEGERFYFFLFCLVHHEKENLFQLPLKELTMREILRIDPSQLLQRAVSNNLIPGCTFTCNQAKFLYSLGSETYTPGVILLRTYYRFLKKNPDSDFCFHFLMHRINGAFTLGGSTLDLMQQMYTLSVSLPNAFRPKIDSPFPCQEITPDQWSLPIVEETEKCLELGAEVVFSLKKEMTNNEFRAAERTLFIHAAFIEKNEPITYVQALKEWGGEGSKAFLSHFTIELRTERASKLKFQEWLIQKTITLIETHLDLKFSKRAIQEIKEKMENETFRRDLAYFPFCEKALEKYPPRVERASLRWIRFIQLFSELKILCSNPDERSLFFEYLYLRNITNDPEKFLNVFSPPLKPLREIFQEISKLKKRLSSGIELLIEIFYQQPPLLKKIGTWPIESLNIDQLLLICANKKWITRCQQAHPNFGLGFTNEQRGFLHALSEEESFKRQLVFVKKLPQKESSEFKKFAFAFLMSSMVLKEASERTIIAALTQRDKLAANEALLFCCRVPSEAKIANLFADYLNLQG